MHDFSVEWVNQMFGGSDFWGSELSFTIGQSPQIWGNFSKIFIKINKNFEKYCENSRKMLIVPPNFLISGWITGKIRKLMWLMGDSEGGGRRPPPRKYKNFQEIHRNSTLKSFQKFEDILGGFGQKIWE